MFPGQGNELCFLLAAVYLCLESDNASLIVVSFFVS